MNAVLGIMASPLARALIIAAVAYSTGYFKGQESASRSCEAASLRARIATLEADLTISTSQRALAEKQARAAEIHSIENQRILDDLASKSKSCPLSGDDARRLRSIR